MTEEEADRKSDLIEASTSIAGALDTIDALSAWDVDVVEINKVFERPLIDKTPKPFGANADFSWAVIQINNPNLSLPQAATMFLEILKDQFSRGK